MNFTVTEAEKKEKKITKYVKTKAFIAITLAFFSVALVHIIEIIFSYTDLNFVQKIFEFLANTLYSFGIDNKDLIYDISYHSIQTLLTLIFILVPFLIANLALRSVCDEKDGYVPLHKAPKFLPLYIFGTIGIGYIINVLLSALFKGVSERFPTSEGSIPRTGIGWLLLLFTTAVLPAVIEEFAFRGTLLKYLLPYGKTGALIISSVIFGLMHIDPLRVVFATAFGFMLGVCYEYTRSIKVTMLIHFINNALAVLAMYSQQYNNAFNVGMLFIGCMGCGVAAIIIYSKKGYKHYKISFNKPYLYGKMLSVKQYICLVLINPVTYIFLATYVYIFWKSYFA